MKIIIIGAGISGLTLGSFLSSKKNNDIEYKIFEKRKNIIEEYNGIQLSPNATRILNLIGFKKIKKKELFFPKHIKFSDLHNGDEIFNIKTNNFTHKKNSYVCMNRNILIKFLIKKIPKQLITFNKKVKKIEHFKNSKIIKFSDGTTERTDLVIIADGVFSKNRQKEFPNNNLKFSGSVAFRTKNVRLPKCSKIDNGKINVFLGPLSHVVAYPVNKKKDFNFVSVIANEKFKKYVSTNKTNITKLKFFFKKSRNFWTKEVAKIFKNHIISCWPIYVVKFNKPWIKNNLVLLGDAAHAMLPYHAQGAAQSIEDAYQLYRSLKIKDLSSALNKYEKLRKLRVSKVILRSNINKAIFHISNENLRLLRNVILKYLLNKRAFIKSYFGGLFEYKRNNEK